MPKSSDKNVIVHPGDRRPPQTRNATPPLAGIT